MRVVCEGLGLPEGPAFLADDSWVVTELARSRGCVTNVSGAGVRTVVATTGRPNGLAVDRTGTIWVAESLDPPSILALREGSVETALTAGPDGPLLWPNDLCFGPDGCLYFTDSGIPVDGLHDGDSIRPDWRRLEFEGAVHRFDVESGRVSTIDRGLSFANGIAFGPDGDLYANETMTGKVHRYRARGEGGFGTRELFGDVLHPGGGDGLRGPDGMAFASDGRLFVAVYGQGEVVVLAPSGEVVERIPVGGRFPTNVAFGPSGERGIYVVEDEHGRLEFHAVEASGLPLHDGAVHQPGAGPQPAAETERS